MKEIKNIIKQEINWHKLNKDKDNSDEFQNGFIKGLQQALDLVEKLNTTPSSK